jgi:hypothetical protein
VNERFNGTISKMRLTYLALPLFFTSMIGATPLDTGARSVQVVRSSIRAQYASLADFTLSLDGGVTALSLDGVASHVFAEEAHGMSLGEREHVA